MIIQSFISQNILFCPEDFSLFVLSILMLAKLLLDRKAIKIKHFLILAMII
jgi:hypothetical protein